MKKIIICILIVLIIIIGAVVWGRSSSQPKPVACTMEAKLCPDGNAVGRTGPDCEFAPCPAETPTSSSTPTPTNPATPIKPPSTMTEGEARAIAERSCIKGGEALAAGINNEGTKTWWFDANLNATRPGCHPACVVSETAKTAEINWRCTGLLR